MDTQIQDMRYGLRSLMKNPGFTAVVVLILTLGIGANGAIFSLTDALLLRPLPYKDSERIVLVMGSNPHFYGDEAAPVSYPDFTDWKNQSHVFEEMAAFLAGQFNLAGEAEAERVDGFRVSERYFGVLQVNPLLGRTFLPEECATGGNRAVLLSYGLWQSHFGSNRDVVGKSVILDGYPHTVVGVMPAGSEPFLEPALWVPLAIQEFESGRGRHFLTPIARLKPGVSLAQARAEMATIANRLEQQYPDTDRGWGIRVDKFHEGIYGPVAPFLIILLAAVGCILLIVCTNVANLLLARGAGREREIAIRAALGASRTRLVRQLLTESLLLALISGCLSLLAALWISDVISTAIAGIGLPIRLPQIQIDIRVMGFTMLASLLTAVLSGLAPALQTSKVSLSECLKEAGSNISAVRSRRRFRSMLVVAEVTLSLLLLTGAGLLIQGFLRLSRTDSGFRPENVVAMSIPLSQAQYPEGWQQSAFFGQLLGRISAIPGVQSAGATSSHPMSGHNSSLTYTIEGRPRPAAGKDLNASFHVVSSSYFATLGIPLKGGRFFTESDGRNAPPVIIINDTLAREQFGGKDPLGQRISLTGGPWRTVVGVVGDVRYTGLGNPVQAEMCVPQAQAPQGDMELVVRAKGDPLSIVGTIRKELRALDATQPLTKIRKMETAVADSVWLQKSVLFFLGAFAAMAIFLTVLGVYGVVSYSASQRTREIGIRMALGAQRRGLLMLVLRQGLILILIGVGLGLAASLAVTPILSIMLYGISPTDPLTFAGAAILLTGVTLIASYIPARRAMRVDPILALRYE